MSECIHNATTRYVDGFYCNDCQIWYDKDSTTYRSTHLLESIYLVLNNINVEQWRTNGTMIIEVGRMKEKIGIMVKHKNYEELISQAEVIMSRHGKHSNSPTIQLK